MSAPSIPAVVEKDSSSAVKTVPHFINGQAVQGESGRFGTVYNPALGKSTARVAFANKAEVNRAVEAATAAFPKWAAMPPLRRARIMNRFRELLEQNQAR